MSEPSPGERQSPGDAQPPQDPGARLAALLAKAPPAPDWSSGYLNLLGTAEQAGPTTGVFQRLMRAELLTAVYEDYWRPVLGRAMKGPSGPSMAGEVALAIERLALEPGSTVLDVACGTGHFTRAFARAAAPGGLAIGLDGSRPMLDKAVARTSAAQPVAYLRASAVTLPFAENTIDALCCFAALHMFDDPEAALDSFRRVLRPGGRVTLLTSGRRTALPARALDTLGGAVSGMRVFDRGEVAELLLARGFTEIVQDYAGVAQIVSGRAG